MARKTKKRSSKLLHHRHTGKLRPHQHTSYGALALVLLMAFLPLLFASHSVSADSASQDYAVVAAPVPKTAPVISAPTNGQTFKTIQPVAVQGSCPSNTLIEVFQNQIMSGATLCKSNSFQVSIQLFAGSDSLIARAYNANDLAGPDSAPVSVRSTPPGVNLLSTAQLNALGIPANQFYMTTQVYYRGAEAGQTMSWPLTVTGGQPPYAVSVGWGDNKTDLVSRGAAGQFTISHIYQQAAASGNYTIVIRGTDAAGNTSYLQLVAIVSGNPAGAIGKIIGGGYSGSSAIKLAWQILLIAILVVLSFWVGERREARVLGRRARGTA